VELSSVELAALQLAALRLVRDFGDIATYCRVFPDRSGKAGASFNLYWSKACKDISMAMADRNSDDAFHLVAILAYNKVFAKD